MTEASQAKVIQLPLGEANLEIRRELLDTGELRLDPDNPRLTSLLAHRSGRRRKPAERELEDLLWKLPQVRALAKSIQQNGGLLEDPLARYDGTLIRESLPTPMLARCSKTRVSTLRGNSWASTIRPATRDCTATSIERLGSWNPCRCGRSRR